MLRAFATIGADHSRRSSGKQTLLVLHLELLEEHRCVLGQGHLLHHAILLLLVAYGLSSKEWLHGTAAARVVLGALGDAGGLLSLLVVVFLLVERLGHLLSLVVWRPTTVDLPGGAGLRMRGLVLDSLGGVGAFHVFQLEVVHVLLLLHHVNVFLSRCNHS